MGRFWTRPTITMLPIKKFSDQSVTKFELKPWNLVKIASPVIPKWTWNLIWLVLQIAVRMSGPLLLHGLRSREILRAPGSIYFIWIVHFKWMTRIVTINIKKKKKKMWLLRWLKHLLWPRGWFSHPLRLQDWFNHFHLGHEVAKSPSLTKGGGWPKHAIGIVEPTLWPKDNFVTPNQSSRVSKPP